MLECEGYKMFRGTATVTPTNPKFPTEAISGTWLYKPEYDCWYVNGRSYTADIVSDFVEFQPTVGEWIPVKEKLPPEDTVLFVTDGVAAWQDSMINCDIYGRSDDYCWTSETPFPQITHWMLLPDLPKVK